MDGLGASMADPRLPPAKCQVQGRFALLIGSLMQPFTPEHKCRQPQFSRVHYALGAFVRVASTQQEKEEQIGEDITKRTLYSICAYNTDICVVSCGIYHGYRPEGDIRGICHRIQHRYPCY